jgi:hypothetical protein
MITPSFSLTATERVLPRLALDWTTGLAQPGVDVTRVGVATFVGSNGFIQSASVDTQRLDWSRGIPGLLVEESRTNVATFSDSLFLTGWSSVNSTRLATTVLYPAGLSGGSSLTDNATNDRHIAFKTFTSVAATYCQSMYFAKGTLRYVQLQLSGPANNYGVIADLEEGVITDTHTSNSAPSAFHGIEDAGNGWWRVWCGLTITAGTSFIVIATSNSATPAYTASGNPTYVGTGQLIYAYGAQVEIGASPTSYIPTEATAVTRNADVATMTGTNFDWFNPTEGTFKSKFQSNSTATFFALTASDGTSANSMDFNSSAPTSIAFQVTASGATSAFRGITIANKQILINITGAYKTNYFTASANGSANSADTLGVVPTIDRLRIGATATGTACLNGWVKNIYYYPQAFTTAEAQAFSK